MPLAQHLLGGGGGKHHAEAQFREQREPHGVVFIHVQHAGDAYGAARGLVGRERRIVPEQPLVLVVEEVGQAFIRSALARAAFAAVAGHEARAVGEAGSR